MTHQQLQEWLDGYIAAWRSGDPRAIGELFTPDATYGYRPWASDQHTVVGRDAIVESWLDDPDDPSTWVANYQPYAVDGNRAVAVGTTEYTQDDRRYHNAFLLQFDAEGRCSEFRDFYVRERL